MAGGSRGRAGLASSLLPWASLAQVVRQGRKAAYWRVALRVALCMPLRRSRFIDDIAEVDDDDEEEELEVGSRVFLEEGGRVECSSFTQAKAQRGLCEGGSANREGHSVFWVDRDG